MIQEENEEKMHRRLVFALETVRMRFSVAMAMEAKSTPRDRWEYYLETTDRMGRCIKKLRKSRLELQGYPPEWEQVLESARNLPDHGKASRLCEMLRDLVRELE